MSVEIDDTGTVIYNFVSEHRWASIADLAEDYWRWSHLKGQDKERDDGAAYGCVGEFTGEGHPRAAGVIQALVDAAQSDADLVLVGAGALEDLMSHCGHGAAFIDEIERHARRDPRFAKAVSSVWLSDDVPDDVRTRLGRFGAADLARPQVSDRKRRVRRKDKGRHPRR